ncbi:hypothetical protein AVEN_121856-1 [Araneus ventricosus]|uniref:Uncharacterized protein n=1 Tax=Araneus ventricosus TaxID=182803 RepID=A0A4Y2JJU4_ARAVE|nr:hypothetical protein AVEN_121856-1 [Araneus ventricosus]
MSENWASSPRRVEEGMVILNPRSSLIDHVSVSHPALTLILHRWVCKRYEKWLAIDEDIPVAATLTDLEIRQAVCKQDQAIKVDHSDGDECVEENPPTNAEMKQALDILKRSVQHRSTNLKKQYEYEQYKWNVNE